MAKKLLFFGTPILIIAIVFYFVGNPDGLENANLEYTVKREKFSIIVNTTGELQAEKSEEINGPMGLRRVRIYTVKIADLIPEGTIVDSGAFVASLDRTELTRMLKDNELDLQKVQNQIKQTELDTTLSLRANREELINLKFSYEEAKIKLEQSKFEPPASIRQAEISLIKAERTYDQSVEKNYKIKHEQAITKMKEVEAQLSKVNTQTEDLVEIANEFTVLAPKKGMVIYKKEWDGKKRQVGSEISPWDPSVATLPDMSQLISKAYINEVDISKIKLEQKATVGVDAFPDRKIPGKVVKIANVGEQKPNSDAKVFEVQIRLNQSDSILKPSMTTANQIYINTFDSVLFVPIDAIFTDKEEHFVYQKKGVGYKKTPVKTGESNENFIIILEGLEDGNVVSINRPE